MSLQVAKVKGIPIRLHFTLLIVFALIAWSLAVGFMPPLYPNIPQAAYWIIGIVGAAVLLLSVLLHELSHSLLSKSYGLNVRQIILFVFGGVSDIKEEAKDYRREFKIAIVGPLSSFALAGLFAAAWYPLALANVTGMPGEDELFYFPTQQMGQATAPASLTEPVVAMTIVEGIMRYGAFINILLGVFNLIPAFPLDGGIMLRAALARRKRSREEATRIAVKIGTGISYAIMAFGFVTIFTGSFIGGIWLILIGWFLQSGAQSYLQHQEITSALSGIHLRDIMNTRFVALSPNMTAKEAAENYFNVYRKSELPVIEKDSIDNPGNLVGAVTAKRIFDIQEENRANVKVVDVLIDRNELSIMRPSETADRALHRIIEENKSRIYVCENHNSYDANYYEKSAAEPDSIRIAEYIKLVGIISKTDILNVAKERAEYAETYGKDARLQQKPSHRFGEAA